MKKIYILILSVVFVSNSIYSQPPVSVFGEANLSVNEDVHDFGQIQKGADGSCIFIVTNTGDQALIISKCEKTCGCTIPLCDPSPILPGEQSEITVSYDTKRLGPFNKSVKIYSNDPDEPMKVLRVKGEVLSQSSTTMD